ncbi:MarR family winged helix-turn-helix transcriptional regulator [Pseudarthrobacter albicanus]|uniref:MarR family winged helix-turn-helix transcriptional regulator n=1 Tax=Pseudarthrobacter albicanus TaxID=2823873 RepID=UPI001BABF2F3|nr:MarR family winged helix-turn-helix transcriptional regulator [Pseudarthrobacter albicanus]
MSECPSNPDGSSATGSVPVPASAAGGPISHAIFRLARLHRMLAGQLLREVGLHPTQELVMMQLWDRGAQRQTDLARFLGSDAATMTRTVRRLENAGFVRRRPCEHDKRVTIVEPTPASLALRTQVESIWIQLEGWTAGGLSAQQQADFLALLERTEKNLAASAPDSGVDAPDPGGNAGTDASVHPA